MFPPRRTCTHHVVGVGLARQRVHLQRQLVDLESLARFVALLHRLGHRSRGVRRVHHRICCNRIDQQRIQHLVLVLVCVGSPGAEPESPSAKAHLTCWKIVVSLGTHLAAQQGNTGTKKFQFFVREPLDLKTETTPHPCTMRFSL